MSFYGCKFVFDGIPCSDFDLMIYDFGGASEGSSALSPSLNTIEDRIAHRYSPIHYGVTLGEPLSFTLSFGVVPDLIDEGHSLDKYDLYVISNWLTAHDEYKWLEIIQTDMEHFRFKCFIRDLKTFDYGSKQWGFTCTVVCDSPYAYLYPETYKHTINLENGMAESINFALFNKSSYYGFYKPKLKITKSGSNGMANLSITNKTDANRVFNISIPSNVSNINVDNENGIITCEESINLYPYFNFNFLRLVRGRNDIEISAENGSGSDSVIVEFICEYPILIGG